MSKNEFIETAKEFGYTDTEIQNFIDLCKETGLKYEDLAIEKHHRLP